MKKPIIVSVIMALMLLMGGSFVLAQPQNSANEEKPTFYRLTPGVYVNGWPRFTIHYPKDWVERHPMPQETFVASAPGPVPYPALIVAPFPTLLLSGSLLPSLEVFKDSLANALRAIATDVTLVSDKPSRLRDGSPAREVELQMVLNGAPMNVMGLVTRKGDLWVNTAIESRNGKIGEDLKTILYSIEFEPDKDKPVKVPPDVQEFLDKMDNDLVSHDVAKVMNHYSDRFLNSGNKKADTERILRQIIGPITSCEIGITEFIVAGDRAYLAGFIIGYWGKAMLTETSIIKENGEWKWYGNQRDVSR
jgi:hypothetical protein